MMTSRNPYEGLISSRKSCFYYLDLLDHDPALRAKLHDPNPEGFYTSMLVEDTARILPYALGGEAGFTATIDSSEDRIPELIKNALPSRHWPARSLTDGLRGFVETTARRVMTGRQAIYEIDYFRKPSALGEAPVAFRLEPLPPRSVAHLDGQPIQYVPAAAGGETTATGLHYLRLDPRQLITIALDPTLTDVVNNAMRVLTAADRRQDTPLRMMQQGQSRTGFEFSSFLASTHRVLLAGTRQIGWDGRGLFTDGALDPYRVWRHLQFVRFKITVRDSVLAGLTTAINRAGDVMGFTAAITLSGVATLPDIDRAEEDLEAGRVPLSELLQLGN